MKSAPLNLQSCLFNEEKREGVIISKVEIQMLRGVLGRARGFFVLGISAELMKMEQQHD